jgi:signal transduction histidine kinase
MIPEEDRVQLLYDISMGIGTSLNLKRMLKTAVSTIIRELNCAGAVVYQAETYNDSVTYIDRLVIPRNLIQSEQFDSFYKGQILTQSYNDIKSKSPLIHKDERFSFVVLPIINYGFIVMMKKGSELDDFFIKSLQPLLLKLSSAIQGCLSNEDLNRKIDIEVKKSREKDMVMFQQARLASIGELIGNISHHWRQPLNTLGLLIQDAQDAYEFGDLDDDYFENFVSESMDKIDLMSKTIDNFRNFFQPNEQSQRFSVEKSIKNSLQLVKEGFDCEKIAVELIVESSDFQLLGFRNEFSQAVLNILNNAKDIFIERKTEGRGIWISIDGDNYTIKVEDSGGGIFADSVEKVFEPYYTTKHQSVGTGIGLYMTKTIVEENMGGEISVKNGDRGAVFTLTFSNQS